MLLFSWELHCFSEPGICPTFPCLIDTRLTSDPSRHAAAAVAANRAFWQCLLPCRPNAAAMQGGPASHIGPTWPRAQLGVMPSPRPQQIILRVGLRSMARGRRAPEPRTPRAGPGASGPPRAPHRQTRKPGPRLQPQAEPISGFDGRVRIRVSAFATSQERKNPASPPCRQVVTLHRLGADI